MTPNYRRGVFLLTLACALLPACGFSLRGQALQLPPEYATLRVLLRGSNQSNDPLLSVVRSTLQTQSGVRIVEDTDAPTLIVSPEHVESQVLSVQLATAKASEYRLRYTVRFELRDAAGAAVLAPQTLSLQRDYTFDATRVLAKEEEQRELVRELRRDAAQQIVRRIVRASAQTRE